MLCWVGAAYESCFYSKKSFHASAWLVSPSVIATLDSMTVKKTSWKWRTRRWVLNHLSCQRLKQAHNLEKFSAAVWNDDLWCSYLTFLINKVFRAQIFLLLVLSFMWRTRLVCRRWTLEATCRCAFSPGWSTWSGTPTSPCSPAAWRSGWSEDHFGLHPTFNHMWKINICCRNCIE